MNEDESKWTQIKNIAFLENLNRQLTAGGSELENAVYSIAAMDQTAEFDYGIFHWNTLVFNYVPAQILGDEFKQSLTIPLENTDTYSLFGHTPSLGSTVTGMVDAFGSFWYFGKLLRTYWPWLPVALVGSGMLVRRWRTSLGARLWLVYGAVVIVVISVAVGKKSRYLFQLYPALAAAAGVALAAAVRRVPTLPVWMLGAALVTTVAVVATGEHVSRSQRAHTAAALEVAADLPPYAPIWITHEVQYGEPQLGKIVGFYGPAPLVTCRTDCDAEAQAGASVVARDHEADHVAAAIGAEVIARHGILVVLKRPSIRDFR